MENLREILFYAAGFGMIAISAHQISRLFARIKLPLVTGLLVTGIVAGPFVLQLIPKSAPSNLHFINDLSLAFIAYAAGSELFLKELRSRLRHIAWMTFGQLVITFLLGMGAVYFLENQIPFMQSLSNEAKLGVSMLAGTIFVARSPASAIAVINEMRAKGPHTSTALGVTVLKDVLVIILFSVCFSVSKILVDGEEFNAMAIVFLLAGLGGSFGLAYALGKLLSFVLKLRVHKLIKTGFLLVSGYGIYFLSHWVSHFAKENWHHDLHLEPLLICILAAFYVTNFSGQRRIFHQILEETGPAIYVLFFTLTGASMSLDLLFKVWAIALLLFGVRLAAMILGAVAGGTLAGDPWKVNRIAWMPYVTQAGVGLGLATLIAQEFPAWGQEFATILIGVIVLNQVVGPPLFKWFIIQVGEDHSRAPTPEFDGQRDCLILGLEPQSVALARQLKKNGWGVIIGSLRRPEEFADYQDLDIRFISEINKESFQLLQTTNAECIVCMLEDAESHQVCELVYEEFGTKDMVVRLNDRANFQKFHALGALIVEPATAIVSLLDHFVRSPNATSLLLGMSEEQDTIDLEVISEELHGLALRDLRLPNDTLILSVKRKQQLLLSHGFTRLRKGDIVTVVGSHASLEKVRLQFEGS